MPSSEIETLKQKLGAERARLWQVIEQAPPAVMQQPGEGGWSAQDILAHLAFAERINVKFARLMLAQDNPVQIEAMAQDFPDYPGPFSLDDFNAYMFSRLHAQPLDQVLQDLRETRRATLDWMDTLTAEQLQRGGQHAAWGDQNIRGMLRILALHDKTHTLELRKRLVG